MSHSIGIPGFVNERRQDILALSGFKQPATVGSKRDRISMYRTRSYLCYRMSRAVKERHKRGPALFTSALPKPKVVHRRQKRLPRMLQSTFGNTVDTCSTLNESKSNKQKKQKGALSTSTPSVDAQGGLALKLRLNTHLWHTKRFKFQCSDGWYIPTKHKSRGLKAVDDLYDKCVIQDVSYYVAHTNLEKVTEHGSIIVTGTIEDINILFALFIDPLEPLITTTDEESDELIVLEAFEKEAVFHAKQQFPAACTGPVLLLVTPMGNNSNVKVHVTCHPSIASTVFQSLSAAHLCTVALVPARLNRLRLRGPESAQALLSLLHAPVSDEASEENAAKLAFLRAVLEVRDLSKHFEDGDTISLALADPRTITFPAGINGNAEKKENAKQHQRELVAALKQRPDLLASDSPLFDHHAEFVFEPEHVFNKAKHAAKVRKWESLFKTTTPFTTTEAGSAKANNAATLPVLLIRKATPMRSFKTQKHRLSGWDIILPAVWGSLVFRHLQLRGGAAAVGSEEMDHLLAKSGIPTFPRDFPDTVAGRTFWNAQRVSQCTANEKRPPLKRLAGHELSALFTLVTHSARGSPTDSATSGVADISGTLIVRGENYLRDFLPPPFEDLDRAKLEEAARHSQTQGNECWVSPHIVRLPALPALMFLQVLLVPTSRGLILDLAELVCPSPEDVVLFVRHKKHTQSKRAHIRATPQDPRDAVITVKGLYGPKVSAEDTTMTPVDDTEELPKEWEGVKLDRKRVPSNPLDQAATPDTSCFTIDRAASATPTDASKVTDTATNVKKSSVPQAGEVVYDIGADQGRQVIGTVTTGQKEHLNNSHFAIGLCNVNALNEMFLTSFGKYPHPQAHLLVLYRNARSDHLRPAVLQIV